MKLSTALEIYEREGPHDSTSRVQTAQWMATKVLHLHLTEQETFALVGAWREASVTRAPFLQKLGEVRQRLQSMGFL